MRGFQIIGISNFLGWHTVLAIFHIGLAFGVFFHSIQSYRWEVPIYVEYNEWASHNASSACDPGQPLCVVGFRRTPVSNRTLKIWLMVPFFSFVSGAHHALASASLSGAWKSTKPDEWNGWYARSVADGVVWIRWADYAISASLMLVVNSVMWVAPPSVQDIVLWFSVQFLIVLVGAGSEISAVCGRHATAMWLFVAALGPYIATWATQFYVLNVAVSMDGNDPPTLVYIFIFGIFLGFTTFPVVHLYKILRLWWCDSRKPSVQERQACRLKCNVRAETLYAGMSFIAKIPLLLSYWAGSSMRGASTKFEEPEPRLGVGSTTTTTTELTSAALSGDASDTYTAMAIGLTLAIVLNFAMIWIRPKVDDLRVPEKTKASMSDTMSYRLLSGMH